jgi:hypothetical protein
MSAIDIGQGRRSRLVLRHLPNVDIAPERIIRIPSVYGKEIRHASSISRPKRQSSFSNAGY